MQDQAPSLGTFNSIDQGSSVVPSYFPVTSSRILGCTQGFPVALREAQGVSIYTQRLLKGSQLPAPVLDCPLGLLVDRCGSLVASIRLWDVAPSPSEASRVTVSLAPVSQVMGLGSLQHSALQAREATLPRFTAYLTCICL